MTNVKMKLAGLAIAGLAFMSAPALAGECQNCGPVTTEHTFTPSSHEDRLLVAHNVVGNWINYATTTTS